MPPTLRADLDNVKQALVETLALEHRSEEIVAETRLFGALPELNSLAVLELIVVLEERFGVVVDGDEVSAENFETVASLTELVERLQLVG